jgi:hypothetical protein
MHLLYNKTKSAPFPSLYRKKIIARKPELENPFNISCDENTQANHVYQHPVHDLQDGGLLVVDIATSHLTL